MKSRKLKLVANVSGFDTLIAEVKIQNFASEVDVKEWTELVCPVCNQKPAWKGGYECRGHSGEELPRTYGHWSQLKRVIKGTVQALNIPRLLKDKEEAVAHLSWISVEEFAKQYVDATRKDEGEKGISLTDSASAKNIFKLLVAVEELDYVIVAKWNDTYEEIIAVLAPSISGRILLREVIPSNLIQVRETLFIDRTQITAQDKLEAKAFVEHFIPKATAETFTVKDYRAQWKEGKVVEVPTEQAQKVADIKDIMAKIVIQVPKTKKKKVK